MRLFQTLLHSVVLIASLTSAASDDESKIKPLNPCTIKSPSTGSFFDLRKINIQPTPEGKKPAKNAQDHSWHARGYDYGANFTLNFCGPVMETVKDVNGIDKKDWNRIGGYYERGGETYSLGYVYFMHYIMTSRQSQAMLTCCSMNNSELVFRGRKLVLNYTNGSPCPASPSKDRRARLPSTTEHTPGSLKAAALKDPDDNGKDSSPGRTKSTIISLLCERDPTAALAAVSFVGSVDDCTYFFEARSSAACPTINTQKQTLGPGGVFGVMQASPLSLDKGSFLTSLAAPASPY